MKCEALLRLIDSVNAEMGEAASDDCLVLLSCSSSPVVCCKFWKFGADKCDRVAAVGVKTKAPFAVGPKMSDFTPSRSVTAETRVQLPTKSFAV